MMRSIEEQASPGDGDAVHQSFAARIPMGRYASNEEIAAYCTGASLVVDGGMLTAWINLGIGEIDASPASRRKKPSPSTW